MISQKLRLWGIIVSVVTVLLLPQTISAETIRIGDIGKHPAAQIKRFAPFTGYLAKQLESEGITDGKVVVVKSISEMANSMRERKVDLFIDSSYPVLAVKRLADIKFLLRRWKKGQADYHGVIFVRKDSGIARVEDLKGKTVAFEEPFSTITYFVPKMALVEKGLRLVQKKDASDPVVPDEVGYVFVGDDPNSLFWVLKERATAGVMNNQNYLNYGKGYLDSLKIIQETFALPRQVVTYRADLDPKLVARIKEILIQMDQSEEGRKALKDFEGTTKFDEISDQDMLSLSKLQKFIDTELGMR
jgi:phosphonate transport system substrate-binding protein